MNGAVELSQNKKQKQIHNMNKNIKHKFLAVVMLLGSMLAGSSCEDNVGINVTPETPFADKTLYEVLVNDPELTDFVEVLNACGPHCADSLFNHSRVYTLWAPVNGTFNKDSIIKETVADTTGNSNRDHVFRTFVEAHIANHLVAANGTLESDNTVLLLNSKNAVFTGDYKSGYTFSGIELGEKNIRVRNGLLHKIVAPSEYKYSIWEYLKIAADVDSVAQYLYRYNVTEFNEGASIKGPIVNGEQTYLDSAFTTTNTWLNSWGGVGNIDSEDSTYIVYVPSNDMWNEMVAKAEKHFNYDFSSANMTEATKYERDSLRKYYARLHNLKYMTYSVNEQKHIKPTDSMMPAYRSGKRPLFSIAELEENVIFEKELSNGVFKVVDAMPYKQTDLYHDTIFLEGENTAMWNWTEDDRPSAVETLTAYKSQLNKKDSTLLDVEVSGGAYMNYPRDAGAATATFKIPKVLSAKYQVAIVFVPKNITNETVDTATMYPNKYLFTIVQNLGSGDTKSIYPSDPDDDTPPFYTNKYGIDTVYVTVDGSRDGERAVIEFPYSESYNGSAAKDYNVTLDIASVAPTNSEKRKGIYYDTSIRVDKIILIPVLDTEE